MYISVIAVFKNNYSELLLCTRTNEPYQGLIDLVGGKSEEGENGFECAYRELQEETGITSDAITLMHLLDIDYKQSRHTVGVYFGCLHREVVLVEEVNPLFWSSLDQDFGNASVYSGSGYLSLVINEIKTLVKSTANT